MNSKVTKAISILFLIIGSLSHNASANWRAAFQRVLWGSTIFKAKRLEIRCPQITTIKHSLSVKKGYCNHDFFKVTPEGKAINKYNDQDNTVHTPGITIKKQHDRLILDLSRFPGKNGFLEGMRMELHPKEVVLYGWHTQHDGVGESVKIATSQPHSVTSHRTPLSWKNWLLRREKNAKISLTDYRV